MPTTHIVRPTIPDIFINRALAGNEAWVERHGARFWPEAAVPTVEEYANENNGDSIFPYGLWRPEGRSEQIQFFLPKSYRGKQRQNFRIVSVDRYEGRFAEDDFNAAVDAMTNALTGVGMVEVYDEVEVDEEVEQVLIGYVDQSRYLADAPRIQDQDGHVRTPERGIIIEVVWRGVSRN